MILASLSLQVFLFLFYRMRKHKQHCLLHNILWLAYLSADSVAIFVLGHLAVRASKSGHHLMYFWAPFVLVHLGGQDTITALSKQDNELWKRHLLTLVTQATMVGYVVIKASWPDRNLKAAMVIMFVSGCFKYAERTACLFLASPDYLNDMSRRIMPSLITGQTVQESQNNEAWAENTEIRTLDMMPKVFPPMVTNTTRWDGSIRLRVINLSVYNDIVSGDAPLNRAQNRLSAHNLHDMLKYFLPR